MMNRIEKSNIDDKLIWIINDEYKLNNLIFIYEDYILSELKKAIDNKIKSLKITLLGKVKTTELLSFYKDKQELNSLFTILIPVKRTNYSRQLEVFNPTQDVVNNINSEDDLIEVIKNIKDIKDRDEIVSYYLGKIKIKDLYRQFKGKDNFIKIYNYIKDILNDKTS